MSLSAVSAFLALASFDLPKQGLTTDEQRIWKKVQPSIVTLLDGGMAMGVGVCVDSKGYFLAHKTVVPASMMFGRLSSGPTIELRRVGMDETTQLVLLHSRTVGSGLVPAVRLGAEPEKAGGTLLAVLSQGPVRAEFVSGERFGVVNPSRRLVPLNELRFEARSSQIGGGLVFTSEGALLGVLGATLGTGEPDRMMQQKAMGEAAVSGARGGGGAALPLPRSIAPAVQFGPAPQTVAYSVSSSVLQRVVSGLMSPTRKVLHPAIGVYCRDSGENGAEVTSVQAGSPAEKAGLRPGDVIFSIGESPVKNQLDVARITMRLRIGAVVEVKFRRDGEEKAAEVSVGAS
jgi:putative serine protease PepD